MAASLSVLQARQRTFLRDAGGSFIDDTDLTAWTNEAQTDIAARTQVLHKELTGTISGNTLAFPAGTTSAPLLVEILSLRLGDDDVEFVSDTDFYAYLDAGATLGHTIARVLAETITLYPTPSSAVAYTLRYAKIPAALVNGEDVHELPLQMERKLVEYAVAQAKYKDGALDEGDRWLARYEQGMPAVSTARERFFTAPLRITREPNIWDASPRASHL